MEENFFNGSLGQPIDWIKNIWNRVQFFCFIPGPRRTGVARKLGGINIIITSRIAPIRKVSLPIHTLIL